MERTKITTKDIAAKLLAGRHHVKLDMPYLDYAISYVQDDDGAYIVTAQHLDDASLKFMQSQNTDLTKAVEDIVSSIRSACASQLEVDNGSAT